MTTRCAPSMYRQPIQPIQGETMATFDSRDDEREATRKMNRARKAKHGAPYAARCMNDDLARALAVRVTIDYRLARIVQS